MQYLVILFLQSIRPGCNLLCCFSLWSFPFYPPQCTEEKRQWPTARMRETWLTVSHTITCTFAYCLPCLFISPHPGCVPSSFLLFQQVGATKYSHSPFPLSWWALIAHTELTSAVTHSFLCWDALFCNLHIFILKKSLFEFFTSWLPTLFFLYSYWIWFLTEWEPGFKIKGI